MPYGYTDEQWARIDSPTKYRIIQEAQKQAKPKTTTTTPKTTTTKTTSASTQKTTANTGATTYNAPSQQTLDSMLGAIKAATSAANSITGAFGMGPPSVLAKSQDDAITSAYNQVTQPDRTAQAPVVDPYIAELEKALAEAQAKDPYADMLAETERRQRELAEAQRQSRIAALGKAKESALSSLQSEEAALKPYYYDLRNRTAAQSDIAAKNFAEYMAAQGIRGSAAGLPEIYRQSALQGQLGTLNRQEAADIADIARRRSGIEQAYQSDLAAAEAGIDAQTMQAYIDSMKSVYDQRTRDLAAMGLTSTGQLTLAGREAQNAELERRAALLAAQHYDDIQAYINTLDPNDPIVPYLYAARRTKMTNEAERAAAAAAAQSEAQQTAWKNAFELFKSVGRITSPEQAQILGLPTNATVADVDIARMNAQTSRMNAQTSAYNAQTSAYNAQQRTQQQADQAASQRIQQYADIIDRLYVNTQYDNDGRAIGKTLDPDAVKAYIQNLNQTGQISDDEARQLLALYNFTY